MRGGYSSHYTKVGVDVRTTGLLGDTLKDHDSLISERNITTTFVTFKDPSVLIRTVKTDTIQR